MSVPAMLTPKEFKRRFLKADEDRLKGTTEQGFARDAEDMDKAFVGADAIKRQGVKRVVDITPLGHGRHWLSVPDSSLRF
jgi:predicted metal-dependent phosphotriesterase family hydrolase